MAKINATLNGVTVNDISSLPIKNANGITIGAIQLSATDEGESGSLGVVSGTVTPTEGSTSITIDTGLASFNNFLLYCKDAVNNSANYKFMRMMYVDVDGNWSNSIYSNSTGSSVTASNSIEVSTSQNFIVDGGTLTFKDNSTQGALLKSYSYEWFAW